MSECRMWAEDPVTPASSVIELPEIIEMEARSAAIMNPAPPQDSLPSIDAPITILGVPFSAITFQRTVQRVQEMIASGRPHYIVTANVDFLVQARADVELHRI